MLNSFEERLAFHCGPALMGVKPGNLMALKNPEYDKFEKKLVQLNEELNHKGIYLETVYRGDVHSLVLVYREDRLKKCLACERNCSMLYEEGYPQNNDVKSYIEHLKVRVKASGGFPHEIGIFLGYPVEDIVGFIQNKGQDFKLNGYWKVYGDEVQAELLFAKFNKSRDWITKQVSQGKNIPQVFGAA